MVLDTSGPGAAIDFMHVQDDITGIDLFGVIVSFLIFLWRISAR